MIHKEMSVSESVQTSLLIIKVTENKRTSSFMISPINTCVDLSLAEDTATTAAASINIESTFPAMVYRLDIY